MSIQLRFVQFFVVWSIANCCWAGTLTMVPTSPTAADSIVFTASYEDPGYAFDGATVTISGNSISILYKQTGYAGFPPALLYFSKTVGPLQPGGYSAQVFTQHRFQISDPYDSPTATSNKLEFTVTQVGPTLVDVVEFFHAGLGHYFITADIPEIDFLTTSTTAGWVRTGEVFKAFPRGTGNATKDLCRFYGSIIPGPNSHFYTLYSEECDFLKALQLSTPDQQPRWNYEGLAFAAGQPQNGACPPDKPVPIRRFYNHRAALNDSNHRYTMSTFATNTMRSAGWTDEGVVMCTPL